MLPPDHVRDRPFVIAITNYDQPFSFMAAQRPIEAVVLGHYVDEEQYLRSGRPQGGLDGEDLQAVLKDSGSPVELGLFRSPAYREISAVIFNACATLGKVRALSASPGDRSEFTALRLNPHSDEPHVIRQPKSQYQESLIDGLRVYHNPFATYPSIRGLPSPKRFSGLSRLSGQDPRRTARGLSSCLSVRYHSAV